MAEEVKDENFESSSASPTGLEVEITNHRGSSTVPYIQH